jgi:pimeloyl-ACP methyl ester carboxylesterase
MSNGDVSSAVLVHAAWFDASSWTRVIAALHRRGFKVDAVQLPLTSFADDVAAVRRVLRRQSGPVVLVGHSYGGAVMTAAGAGDRNVKALVYIAAIVPDENETVGEVFSRAAPHAQAPSLDPDVDGLLWVTAADFRNAVAPDAAEDEASIMAATQKPISVACLGEKMTKPAWREKPSWFLIAENDRMVAPETQRFLAQRMKSTVVAVRSDHLPLTSHADDVAKLVIAAAQSPAASS